MNLDILILLNYPRWQKLDCFRENVDKMAINAHNFRSHIAKSSSRTVSYQSITCCVRSCVQFSISFYRKRAYVHVRDLSTLQRERPAKRKGRGRRKGERRCVVIFAPKSNTDEIPRLIQMDDTAGTSATSCTVVAGVPISGDDQLLHDPPTHPRARARGHAYAARRGSVS